MNFASYLLQQETRSGCGIAALQTLISYTYRTKAYVRTPLASSAPNFLAMREVAAKYGVKLEARKTLNKHALYREKTMFIAQFNNNGAYHFVTVKRRLGRFLINDPAGATYLLKAATFFTYFTGNYAVVTGYNENKIQRKNALPKRKHFLLYLLNTLLLFSVIAAFYFLGEAHDALITYVLLVLSSLLFISEKAVRLYLYKRFDETIFLQTRKHISNVNELRTISESKALYFRYKFDIYARFINITLVSVLLIINGPIFIFIVLFTIVVAVLVITVKVWQSDSLFNLAYKEQSLFLVPKHEQKTIYHELNNDVFAYSIKSEFTRIVAIIFLLSFTFVVMFTANIYTLNFFLFYLFLFIFLFHELVNFIETVRKQSLYNFACFTINRLLL